MMPSNDEYFISPDRAAERDDGAPGGAASIGGASPTLARWYRASARNNCDRTRHLNAISEAIASARPGEFSRDSLAPAIDGSDNIDAARADDARPTMQSRVTAASADFPPPAPRLALQDDGRATARPREFLTVRRLSRTPWARAAALVVFAAGGIALLARGHREPTIPPTAPTRDVGFALRLPDATVRNVSLAGDFNGWDASTLPMVRDPADGTWRVRIPLAPGRHTYSYVIDGTRWVIDPLAPRTVEGALGPTNVIAVMGDT